MDASDDAGVDADGPLDPRIQVELENLNNATDEINKLEIELDEGHTAFRQLLSDSTRRLKDIANRIGTGCIEKARCYYKALEVAQQAQVQCQRQAQLFQRANEIHSAAKETVALAEARFMSHQHEWNFDQAWQDMLNHATIKVMDADNQKAECGREHLRRAMLFHDAEKKVQQLEGKHRRSIIKSRAYFEVRSQCDEMLATQKARVEYLQKAVKKAKDSYAASLRVLEDISNQIHRRRRDYDIMTKGPREPGVGAELISPAESLNYESELDKLSLSRINSLASSEPDIDERAQDFDDVFDLKHRMEQLSARSVDGSESNSSQWELELQASVERLNAMPIRKFHSNTEFENLKNDDDEEKVNKSQKNDDNETRRTNNVSTSFKKPLARTDSTTFNQSSFYKSDIFSTNAFSKSLNNSLVNIGNLLFKKESDNSVLQESNLCVNPRDNIAEEFCAKLQDGGDEFDVKKSNKSLRKKRISVDQSNPDIAEFTEAALNNIESEEKGDAGYDKMSQLSECESEGGSTTKNAQNEQIISNAEIQTNNVESKSTSSTPVRQKILSKSKIAKSYENNLDRNFVECAPQQRSENNLKTSSVRELPLLSIIQRFPNDYKFSKDRSCSMTDLAEKQNRKTIADRPKS